MEARDFPGAKYDVLAAAPGENMSPNDEPSRFERFRETAKTTALGALVTAEVLPITNEGMRYGALAATEFMTHSPVVGAAVLGGTTLLVEGAGALAAGELLSKQSANRALNWANKYVDKWVPADKKLSRPLEAGITLTFGTPIAMLATQRQNPDRTIAETRRYGLRNATWLAGVCAVEGALISEGVGNYTDPAKVGAALLAIGGIMAVGRKVKGALRRDYSAEAARSTLEDEAVEPRYDLSQEEMDELGNGLVMQAKQSFPGHKGIVRAWINPRSRYANFLRMHEASYFEEVEEVSSEDEDNTLFLALIDVRKGAGRVVHGATITGANVNRGRVIEVRETGEQDDRTGMYTVDSLIELDNFSAADFKRYYEKKGINPDKCLAVETNFRIGERAKKYKGIGMAEIAYMAMFDLAKSMDKTLADRQGLGVFASINEASRKSFARTGIKYEPLMGRTDFVTEESLQGRDSQPVFIPDSRYISRMFSLIKAAGVKVPEMIV